MKLKKEQKKQTACKIVDPTVNILCVRLKIFKLEFIEFALLCLKSLRGLFAFT